MRPVHATVGAAFLIAALAPAHAPASQLSQVISKGNHLITLNRLGITAEQLDKLLPLAEKLTGATKTWQSDRQTLLTQQRDALARAREAMLNERPLPEQTEQALEELEKALEANDEKLYAAAVGVLGSVRNQLYPQQNAYIDWTPPKPTARTSREAFVREAEREREQRAIILFADQFLSRARYADVGRYIIETPSLVDDFLRPLIPAGTPEYGRAQAFVFKLVEQARLMNEQEWQARREEVAMTLVRELGLLQPVERAVEERPYSWQDMYEIFSDPGTPDVLRDIKKALTTSTRG